MIWTLIKKEYDALRPFVWLIIAIYAISFVMLLFEMPHLDSYPSVFEDSMSGEFVKSIVLFLMAIALTSGLLMREYDEGTIEFLDSLPLSRSQIFFSKTFVAFSVLSLFVWIEMAICLVLHFVARDSLEPGFHWQTVGILLALRLCQLSVMFSIGLAASFMRRFGWLAIGIVVVVFVVMKDRVPAVEVLNFFAYADPGFEGEHCVIAWKQLTTSLILAAVLMTFSFVMFRSSDRIIASYNRMSNTRLGGAFLILGSLGIATVSVVLWVMAAESDSLVEEDEPVGIDEVIVEYPSWNTSRARTEHFNAIFPANLSGKAEKILKQSDQVFDDVQQILGSEEENGILLDATSLIPRHAGLATWHTIRIDLNASDDIDTLLSILAHETAHVIMETMSERRLSDIFNNTRFWHEGVASYIEFHHFNSENNIRDYYRQAAYMRERDEVEFEELMDNAKLVAKYDTLLTYSIGMIFVEALAKKHSEAAIGKVVKAINRPDAPKDLTGMEFWRDTFQSCGFSLDEVINTFFERLDEEVDKQHDWLQSIPEIKANYWEDEDWIVVGVDWKPKDGWEPICRFRQTEDAPDRQYKTDYYDSEIGFCILRDFFPSGIAWYQLGLQDPDGVRIYQPWVDVAIE